jgi:hypothetical protein
LVPDHDAKRTLHDSCARPGTGTNLLGWVKRLSIVEAWYLGKTFDRPFVEDLSW